MKAWLKGGLWGILIGFILSIIVGFFGLMQDNFVKNIFFVFLLPGLIISMAIKFNIWGYEMPEATAFEYFLVFLFSTAVYFFIGALIGLIIGKIKGRK